MKTKKEAAPNGGRLFVFFVSLKLTFPFKQGLAVPAVMAF
jgi:hypothetical protein